MEASEQRVDLELIAAFTDGRLSGAERERAVKLLAESEAAFEVYADALRVRAALEDAKVVPITAVRRQRGARGWWMGGALAAAAVLMLAILPTIQRRQDAGQFSLASSVIIHPLLEGGNLASALGTEWDAPLWRVTRGAAAGGADSTISFRLGVRAVHLQVALGIGDTARAHGLSSEILETLDEVELSDAVRAEYSALRSRIASGVAADQLAASASRAEAMTGELLGTSWFDYGRWLGAGELAARTRSEGFFASRGAARFLELAGERRASDADDLGRVAALAREGVTSEEFDTIRQIFESLIRQHGG